MSWMQSLLMAALEFLILLRQVSHLKTNQYGSEKAKLTRHKYNSIISKLVNINLIEGGNGRYRLTQLGCLTLSYVNLIQDALNMHWKLKAIDLIEGSDESIKDQILQTLFNTFPNEELKVLVKKSCSCSTNNRNQ